MLNLPEREMQHAVEEITNLSSDLAREVFRKDAQPDRKLCQNLGKSLNKAADISDISLHELARA